MQHLPKLRLVAAATVLFAAHAGGAAAAPSIAAVQGPIQHGAIVSIQGSGFGQKATAAPTVWDDASGSDPNQKWDQLLPNSNDPAFRMAYRSPSEITKAANSGPAPQPPHKHDSRYLAGAHYNSTSTDADSGWNVGLTKYGIQSSPYTYFSFYYRADPDWYAASGSDDNHKMYSYAAGNGMYPSNNYWYFNPEPNVFGSSSSWSIGANYQTGSPKFFDSCTDIRAVDGSVVDWYSTKPGGNGTYYPPCNAFPKVSVTSPKAAWVKIELILKHADSTNGVHIIRQDNQRIWYVELNDDVNPRTTNIRSESIGGYSRDAGSTDAYRNNWRYFSDVYYDKSWARVIFANAQQYQNASIVEPQIPQSWNSSGISIKVNLGRLDPSTPIYAFVFDSSGQRNAAGFPVTASAGGAAPSPPTNVRATPQ